MIQVKHKNRISELQNQMSLFKSQEDLDAHKIEHPELYDAELWDVEITDITEEVTQGEKLNIESKIDLFCRKAYTLFKIYNRKNFSLPHVQAFFAHADAMKFYVMIDGGSPTLAKQLMQVCMVGYPEDLTSKMNALLSEAEALGNL